MTKHEKSSLLPGDTVMHRHSSHHRRPVMVMVAPLALDEVLCRRTYNAGTGMVTLARDAKWIHYTKLEECA